MYCLWEIKILCVNEDDLIEFCISDLQAENRFTFSDFMKVDHRERSDLQIMYNWMALDIEAHMWEVLGQLLKTEGGL